MVDNYRAESFMVEWTGNPYTPRIHFSNLEVAGGKHSWEPYRKKIGSAIKRVDETISRDSHLKQRDVGKFAIAFPFGFVIYCFGTPGDGGEIDSICVKYAEFSFEDNFSRVSKGEIEIPCQLEDKIKVYETGLWNSSKTVSEYYSKKGDCQFSENLYPNKKFD